VGDPHASQGDSELCGTAIECSLTGTFQLLLRKKATLKGTPLEGLDYPLLETQNEYVFHGFSFANYLAELGPRPGRTSTPSRPSIWRCATPSERCGASDDDPGTVEDEAISLISSASTSASRRSWTATGACTASCRSGFLG
jgi:hypothetical protein